MFGLTTKRSMPKTFAMKTRKNYIRDYIHHTFMIYPKIKPFSVSPGSEEEWTLFDPSWNAPHSVIVFDPQHKHYESLENTWYLCGTKPGKVRLIHRDKETIVDSISKWKVIEKLFITPYIHE